MLNGLFGSAQSRLNNRVGADRPDRSVSTRRVDRANL